MLQTALFLAFYGYVIFQRTTSSISRTQGTDLLVVSMSWLLIIVLQSTLRCMYLFELWCSLDICPGEGLLDHMATFFFKETSTVFSIMVVPNYIPTNSIGGLPFLHTLSSN